MDANRTNRMSEPASAACDPSSARQAYAGSGGNGHHAPPPDPTESFRRVSTLLAEAKEYAAYYLSAKIDGLKLTGRKLGIYAALGIVGLIIGSAVLTTAVVLFLVGAAWGLGVLFGYRLWLGALAVGLLILGALALGVIFGLKALNKRFKASTVKKYEQRQNWERGQFGRNVTEQAAAGPH